MRQEGEFWLFVSAGTSRSSQCGFLVWAHFVFFTVYYFDMSVDYMMHNIF